MDEDNRPCFNHHASFAKYVLFLAVLIILGTVIPSIFALEPYGSMCICVINFLAYAWIAFAVASLFSVIILIGIATLAAKENCCRRSITLNLLLWLQGLAFISGLVFLIIFIVRYTNVV